MQDRYGQLTTLQRLLILDNNLNHKLRRVNTEKEKGKEKKGNLEKKEKKELRKKEGKRTDEKASGGLMASA